MAADLLILTSPSELRRTLEQLREPCSSPFEARYLRPSRSCTNQQTYHPLSLATHLCQDGCQLELGEVGRRLRDVGQRDGHMLKDDVATVLEAEALEHAVEVAVAHSLKHAELAVDARPFEALDYDGIAGKCSLGCNGDEAVKVKLVVLPETDPRRFLLDRYILERADTSLRSFYECELLRTRPSRPVTVLERLRNRLSLG